MAQPTVIDLYQVKMSHKNYPGRVLCLRTAFRKKECCSPRTSQKRSIQVGWYDGIVLYLRTVTRLAAQMYLVYSFTLLKDTLKISRVSFTKWLNSTGILCHNCGEAFPRLWWKNRWHSWSYGLVTVPHKDCPFGDTSHFDPPFWTHPNLYSLNVWNTIELFVHPDS